MTEQKLEVIISERIYNGKVEEGKVIARKYVFEAKKESATIELVEVKYPNDEISKKEEIPFDTKDTIQLTSILPIFENKYLYDEEVDKTRDIPQRLNYTDVYVNGRHAEIEKDNELLSELKKYIKVDLVINK